MTQLIDLGKLRFYFAGEYAGGTTYEINDVVKYGGNVYVYISVVSAAGNLPTDTAYWSLMLKGINFEGPYVNGTAYQVGDGVAHGGKVYISILNSQSITPPNATYWSQFVDGIQYEGTYNGSTTYQKNDVVKYGSKAYIAKVDGAGNLPTNATYWDKLVDGISASGVYNNATAYIPGDTVAYGANTYINILESTGNVPTSATYWTKFSGGIDYRNNWATTVQYYPDDVVNRGGKTYICLVAHVAAAAFATDLNNNRWESFNGGIRVTGNFAASTAYLIGDLAFDGVDTFVANQDFTSGGSIAADSAKWDLFAKGADYLPGQVGNAGKILGTDGTDPFWGYKVNKLYISDVATVTDTADEFETNAGLTNVTAALTDTSTSYTQIAYKNEGQGTESSADIIIYSDQGTNDDGFIDMGMANSKFSSATYGITGPNDGYIFVQGVPSKTRVVTNSVLTTNVVTLTTSVAHGFKSGLPVVITGLASAYNGTYTIIATPTTTTFTYAKTNANIAAASGLSASAFQSYGNGDLVLATGDNGQRNAIVFAAGGFASGNEQVTIIPDEYVHIEIPTPSTSPTTGALRIVGGVGIQGDLNMAGDLSVESGGIIARDALYVGADAPEQAVDVGTNVKTVSFKSRNGSNVATITTTTAHNFAEFMQVTIAIGDATFNGVKTVLSTPTSTTFTYASTGSLVSNTVVSSGTASQVPGFTNPIAVFVADADDYAQVAVQNIGTDPNSSSDIIAYANNGDDFAGYIDMGITSDTFNDPEFTITGANDGYIFMDAPVGTTGAGNLVFATGDRGLENKIVFAAGGLSSDNTQMVITPDVNVHIEIPTASISPTTGALTVVGGVGIQGDVYIQGTISFGGSGTTVSTANLSVTDPLIFVGADNPQNNFELGLVAEYALVTTTDPTATVTAVVVSSNLATFALTYPGGATLEEKFRVNDSVVISGVNGTFNGTYAVAAIGTNSITVNKTTADVTLTGLSGAANATNVYRPKYAGLAKDNSDSKWKLFSNLATRPAGGTIDFTSVSYDAFKAGATEVTTLAASTSASAPFVSVTNALPTAASHATRKDYVDNVTFAHPFMMAAL
jgi:hypothetical protein